MATSKKKLLVSSGSFPVKEKSAKPADEYDDDIDEFLVDTKNEQLLLGHALTSDVCKAAFAETCTYDDFLVGNHKVIAFCIEKAASEGVQITDEIFDVYRYDYPGDEEKKHGGISYIAKLRKSFKSNLTKKSYLAHVTKLKTDSVKYKIQNSSIQHLLKMVRDPSSSLEDITAISSHIDKLVSESGSVEKTGFRTMAEVNVDHAEEVKNRGRKSFGSTGFNFIDEYLTEGFARKRVSVAAGRPGMGKSTFVNNSMIRLGNKGIPNCLFALEMDRISTLDRLNAIETDIPLKKLIRDRHELTKAELEAEKRVMLKREKKPIYICDDVGKTLPAIKRELKAMVDNYAVRVCFIDLFMKIKKPKGMGNKSTTDQYTEMLNEIQVIARDLNVHICVVVQIGRKAEARNDKRPVISDLKDSGAFEEVADLILLFYREAYYLSKNVEDDFDIDIVEINIGKQRQGTTGTAKALFVGETTKLRKLGRDDEDQFRKMVETMKPKEGKKRYD